MQNYVWEKGEEKLEKIPLDFQTGGALTGFSRFTEFGFMLNPSHKYVYFPKKELLLEEIIVHAIKFARNANDLTLCILFYLKNRARAKVNEIEKNCEKIGILETWFDIVNYIDSQTVKNPAMFLPREEFQQKAKLYGIETIKRYDQASIQKLFKEISNELKEIIPIYFIGGNALIEHKTKNSTKDIDIVLTNEKQAATLVGALKRIGFTEVVEKEFQYGQLETSAMLERKGDPRVDLFVRKICSALELSKKMQERSKQINKDTAEIHLSSLEDVFLLKSVSSRDSDLIDCESILQKTTLNWEIVYGEIVAQQKNLVQTQELIILNHLEALEKRMNIKIPLTKKVAALCLEKGILYLAKKPVSIEEIQQKIDFPETTIRNQITRLIKKKKLKKVNNKPLKVQNP
jgi:predicted nucleotidyltransferase